MIFVVLMFLEHECHNPRNDSTDTGEMYGGLILHGIKHHTSESFLIRDDDKTSQREAKEGNQAI